MVVEVQAKISFFHLHYTEGKLDSFRYLKIVLKDAKERRTGSGTKYAGPRAKPRKFAEGFWRYQLLSWSFRIDFQ